MFQIECTCLPSPDGFTFWPEDSESDSPCELRVTFEPIAYYPPEPDVGAGHDFDARVASIEMLDASAPVSIQGGEQWRVLTGNELHNAHAFLGKHHWKEMWAVGEAETLEAFGVDTDRLAA